MATRHLKFLASGFAGFATLVCLWYFLAPTALGGSTSYVSTDGISMEPRFHTGDLAIVRSQSSYHVGEIVAYHSKMLGTVVLHRIVGMDGAKYIFKGDNNNFYDFEHPTRSQLIGALWIHLPGMGRRLKELYSPTIIGLLVLFAALCFMGTAFTRRKRRERKRGGAQSAPAGNALRLPEGTFAVNAIAIGVLVAIPLLTLALLSFTRPAHAPRQVSVPYKQTGRFSYSANSTPGPIYPGNHAVTGDPLFTHVVNDVNMRFVYAFHSAAAHTISGHMWLQETVASTSGWSQTLQLGPSESFHGDRASVETTLELSSLLALLRRVQQSILVSGNDTVTITPKVSVTGALGNVPLKAAFAPSLPFSISELELNPGGLAGASTAAARSAGTPAASPYTPSSSGAAEIDRSESRFIYLGPTRIAVTSARAISLGGLFLVICAVLLLLKFVRPGRRDEVAAILARYGRMTVAVERVWLEPGTAVIDVSGIEDLVQIAVQYERPLMHEAGEQGDAFWVSDETGLFRYAIVANDEVVQGERYDADYDYDYDDEGYTEPFDEVGSTESFDRVRYDDPAPVTAYEGDALDSAYGDVPFEPKFGDAAFEPAYEEQALEPAYYEPASGQAYYEPASGQAYGEEPAEPVYEDPALEPAYSDPAMEPRTAQLEPHGEIAVRRMVSRYTGNWLPGSRRH
jgi:signal peptidase I